MEGAEREKEEKDQSDSAEAGAVLNRRRQNEGASWEMHASPKECEKSRRDSGTGEEGVQRKKGSRESGNEAGVTKRGACGGRR